MFTVALDIGIDFCHKFFDAPERPATDRLLCNDVELDLYLIQPRRIGWRVVDLIARMSRQPAFDRWMLVYGVVIDDEMNIKL